eukprot:TRINITY_DN4210_c0_g1_i2.p1 TRINITY_DN4210_c0_g1~~TRINITY_DN4210_c0_g1_i2.p1  ORF type:complete len:188 (+),score=13.12 TRINITY_DN4210_c0_g1_i2:129-692(+)
MLINHEATSIIKLPSFTISVRVRKSPPTKSSSSISRLLHKFSSKIHLTKPSEPIHHSQLIAELKNNNNINTYPKLEVPIQRTNVRFMYHRTRASRSAVQVNEKQKSKCTFPVLSLIRARPSFKEYVTAIYKPPSCNCRMQASRPTPLKLNAALRLGSSCVRGGARNRMNRMSAFLVKTYESSTKRVD